MVIVCSSTTSGRADAAKDVLKLDEWARDLAPSVELIHWFGHDPARWDELSTEFQLRRALSHQQRG